MKVVGIDLAGLPKNKTGFCRLREKNTEVKTLKKDEEIIKEVKKADPQIVGIDGPLSKPSEGNSRKCDKELKEYGTLPPLMSRGMRKLTERAIELSKELEKKGYETHEVSVPTTAEKLGIKREKGKEERIQKELIKMDLKGTIGRRMLTMDELDSIIAALTVKLYLKGKTEEIGDEEGKIIVPAIGG